MIHKIIEQLSKWAWFPCYFCGWPLPDGTACCPKCNNGSNK